MECCEDIGGGRGRGNTCMKGGWRVNTNKVVTDDSILVQWFRFSPGERDTE